MTENNGILKINNEIVRYKADSVKVVSGALHNTRISQSGSSRESSNFLKGDRLDYISFDLINDERGRKVNDLIMRENEGVVSVSYETDDKLESMSNGATTEDIEKAYGSEGDITGYKITGVVVTSNKR